jgi:hypothetical protein
MIATSVEVKPEPPAKGTKKQRLARSGRIQG